MTQQAVVGTVFMTTATPLGCALLVGNATAEVLLAHVEVAPEHLGDAVEGADPGLIRRVLAALGDRAPLGPSIFWRVRDPAVLPVLAEHGLDLTQLPTDTGTWGGPIWSWWAYDLRGGETRLACFAALFAAGVRATAAGLGDVLGANLQGAASTEMIDLFLANGADLGEEVTWEGTDWDDERDAPTIERGSLAERMMHDADVEIVQHLHAKGGALRPMRAAPDWCDAEAKEAWLEGLGLVAALDPAAFPWLDLPSDDEIRAFFADAHGIYGLRLGATREELPAGFDVARAEAGDGLCIGFDDEGRLASVSRQYHDRGAEAFEAALTAALGRPAGGRTRRWRVPGGEVTLRERHNDAGSFVYVDMLAR
ncbi:MAG: hypothetical protein R3F59_31045 [Myxococcota bacterium]